MAALLYAAVPLSPTNPVYIAYTGLYDAELNMKKWEHIPADLSRDGSSIRKRVLQDWRYDSDSKLPTIRHTVFSH